VVNLPAKALGGRAGSKGCKFQMELEDMAQTRTLSLLPSTSNGVSFVELRQSFPSQIQAMSPLVDQLMHFIAKSRSKDGSEMDIEIALREALGNAIVHGNGDDPDKCVSVTCRCTPDGEVSITVQDEGQGFETGTMPDPTALENRLRTSGRGIYLMKALMDEVHFENGGAVVRMCKKPNRSSAMKSKAQ
jgi:serine/threonine-protein kinase RsbW